MPFDLSIARQSSNLEHAIKAKLYKSIYETASESKRKKRWIKLSGLGFGVISGVLTMAKRVARVGESLLKGLINIFGAPLSDQCCAKRGLKMLFLETPFQLVVKLPLSLITLIVSIPFKAGSFAISPKSYAKSLWIDHDLIEKQIQIDTPKVAIFKQAEDDFLTNSEDLIALKTLGDCYYRGFGVLADQDKAIEFYTRAADLQDGNSMKILGDIYEKEDRTISLEWYKKGSDAGDLDASFKLGLHHYAKGRQSSINTAIEFFNLASINGHVLSKACLLEILPADEGIQLGLTSSDLERSEARSYLGIK